MLLEESQPHGQRFGVEPANGPSFYIAGLQSRAEGSVELSEIERHSRQQGDPVVPTQRLGCPGSNAGSASNLVETGTEDEGLAFCGDGDLFARR
jgi:hypothetical protein